MNANEYEVDGSLRIPRVPCTENAFFHYLPHLKIRELLCWALRTETDVRLAKIKGRLGQKSSQDNKDVEEDYTYSRVLKSNYLIDLYPEEGSSKKQDLSERGYDEYLFSRKAHSQIEFEDGMDDNNFGGLTPIQIEKKKREKSGKKRPHSSHENDSGKDEDLIFGSDDDSENGDQKKAAAKNMAMHLIPPTLLHFQIVLEAYTGYNLGASSTSSSCYNSPDASVPRAAIMGGAVVAALTSFQDEAVVQAFASSGIFTKQGELSKENDYFEKKQALIMELHTHFLYDKRRQKNRSVYSKGDTDIFLQASPLTQALMNIFEEHGISDDQITAIGSFIGHSGRNSISAWDFERFADVAMGNDGKIKAPDETSFAFAASKTAASFILGTIEDEDDAAFGFDDAMWPRTSQFIMLDVKADLLGGLLDFDQSIAACAFDGLSVRVTPRAALSLMTKANFVTPFCLEEHRNRRRVVKYSKRGFKPFLVDPYDGRPTQNVACEAIITRKPFLPRGGYCEYRSLDQTWSGEDRNEVLDAQERKVDEGKERMFCCHRFDDGVGPQYLGDVRSLYEPGDLDRKQAGYMHTIKLFERSPGDAIDFFSRRFHWSTQDMRLVNEIDPYLRMACQKCKQDYNLIRIVMANYPDLLKEYELDDDILHGQFAYSSSTGSSTHYSGVWFEPSFYSGGVFDSTYVRCNARRTLKIYALMFSQSVFELSAYVMKHGSAEGYKKRFVFECGDYAESDLIRTLRKAQRTMLQEPARPPIGLNPERFVEKCGKCQSWLVGNMYGSKQCKTCSCLP